MTFGAALVLGFLVLLVASARNEGYPMWRAILVVVLGAPTVLLVVVGLYVTVIATHELGHALVARLLGFRVFALRIGIGRRRRTFRLGGFPIELYSVPLGGEVLALTRDRRLFRTRMFLHVLAGPAATGTLAWVAYRYSAPPGSVLEAARNTLLLLSLVLLVGGSLWPMRGYLRSGSRRELRMSDGVLLLSIPRLSSAHIEEATRSYGLYEALDLMEGGDHDGALQSIARAVEGGFPRLQLLLLRSWPLLALRRFSETRADLLELLEAEDLDATTRATAANNIAWADVLVGDPTLIEEADRMSEQAVEEDPSSAAFIGTRGAVLVELGRIAEGIDHLERSFGGAVRREDRALTYAWLAIGEARGGNLIAARQHFDDARRADTSCVMLQRAEAAVLPRGQ